MSAVLPLSGLHSLTARKKFGKPNGYGQALFGFSFFGDDNPFSAIYQMRRSAQGSYCVKMKFYRPPVSRTAGQDVLRDKFLAAVSAWQALTPEERQALRVISWKVHKRAYNVYISNYMKT